MIPTPSERGPLELLNPDRFDLAPVGFDLAFFASRFDERLKFADREAETLAAGIVDAGAGIKLANEENGQTVGQVESDSAIIQENVNPPGSELDQIAAWTPFVDLQMDVAGGQLGVESSAAAQAQPFAATSSPPPGASPQGVQAAAASLLRVDIEENE